MNNLRKPKTAPRLKRPYKSPDGKQIMLTDQQHQFTEAALTLKDSDTLINRVMDIYQTNRKSARVIARQNFLKPNIVEYLGDRGYQALDVLQEAMKNQEASWSDRIRAADSIADRAFGRAVQQIEARTTSVSIQVDLTLPESSE